MRIETTISAQREEFAYKAFRKSLTKSTTSASDLKSVKEVRDLVANHKKLGLGGRRPSLSRLYAIRKLAFAGATLPAKVRAGQLVGGFNPNAAQA